MLEICLKDGQLQIIIGGFSYRVRIREQTDRVAFGPLPRRTERGGTG